MIPPKKFLEMFPTMIAEGEPCPKSRNPRRLRKRRSLPRKSSGRNTRRLWTPWTRMGTIPALIIRRSPRLLTGVRGKRQRRKPKPRSKDLPRTRSRAKTLRRRSRQNGSDLNGKSPRMSGLKEIQKAFYFTEGFCVIQRIRMADTRSSPSAVRSARISASHISSVITA